MAARGRETKYNAERHEQIITDLAAGLTRACAAARVGIGETTFSRWMTRGRKGEDPYLGFSEAVKKAERDAEAKNIKLLQAAGEGGQLVERKTITRTKRDGTTETEVTEKYSQGQWTALAWWAERKFPESWGKDTEILREIMAEYRRRKATDG